MKTRMNLICPCCIVGLYLFRSLHLDKSRWQPEWWQIVATVSIIPEVVYCFTGKDMFNAKSAIARTKKCHSSNWTLTGTDLFDAQSAHMARSGRAASAITRIVRILRVLQFVANLMRFYIKAQQSRIMNHFGKFLQHCRLLPWDIYLSIFLTWKPSGDQSTPELAKKLQEYVCIAS